MLWVAYLNTMFITCLADVAEVIYRMFIQMHLEVSLYVMLSTTKLI